MADNPFLRPDGTMDIFAIVTRSKRSEVPIEGEVVPPSAREQGLNFMLNAMKEVHRNPRRPVIEGEVITQADNDKRRADDATMIVDIGLAVLATGDYVAIPPVWQGGDVEKEVRDITPLQIEKKD